MLPGAFVEKYVNDASESMMHTGVPVLVSLAQAALESGWGKHAPGNNFFGIKDSDRVNFGVQTKMTTEYKNGSKVKTSAKFETFPNAFECFKFHGELLKARFPKAFRYTDPVDFIKSVQHDHGYVYATDPHYVEKISLIIKIIQREIL